MHRSEFMTLAAAIAVTSAGSSFSALAENASTQIDWLRYDHVSIHVADFDGMLRWYQDTLGFKLEVSWRVSALNGKQLAYLSKNGAWIELVSAAPVSSQLPPVKNFEEHFSRIGYGHVCFVTSQIDDVMRELEDHGVPAFVKAETYPLDGTVFERRVAFIQDPEGNVIEFGGPLVERRA